MSRVTAGIGGSEIAESRAAGREAASAAVSDLGDVSPALVIVYTSIRYDLRELLAGIREITGDTPLVGATSCGHFFDGRLVNAGEGVAVLVLSRGDYAFGVASVANVTGRGVEAGRELAESAKAAVGDHRLGHAAVLLLADGLQPEQQTLINGIYAVGGVKVPIVGGAAGDDRQLTGTKVFHDDQVLADAAVAVWIESPRPLTVAIAHGWKGLGLPMLVTSVEGTVVHEIGGRPANEVIREKFNRANSHDPDDEADPDRWYSAHALGLVEPDGSMLIRGAYRDEAGLTRTLVPVPAYAAVQIVTADADAMLDVTEHVAADALGNTEPGVLLGFSCVARIDVLGDRCAEEPELLQKAAGCARTFGFFTYGEFARTKSVAGVHNATLAAIAL